MVVDDDPVVHLILRRTVARLPDVVEVEEVLQPEKGLARFKDFAPDILLVDINMPQMTGWQFLEALGQTPDSCRVYIFTSSIDPADRQRARDYANVVDYVVKPLTKERLSGLL
jgi:CheY-like chemotaxis protein